MEPDELRWRQVQQLYDFLRLAGNQGMAWFIFGCTINATAAWALLDTKKIRLQTPIIPGIFVICNLFAVIACVFVLKYYQRSNNTLHDLLGGFSTDSIADARKPMFPYVLYRVITQLMMLDYFMFAVAWAVGMWLLPQP